MTGEIVGRKTEREQLREALQAATAGHGTAVTISGEAGIGKTVLATAIAADAGAAGATLAAGAGWAGGGAPAFWPWNQVLRSLAATLDDDALAQAMGPGAPYLVHLVPQLRARLPDVEPPGELDSDQARFSLFDAVLNFLIAAAERRPLVILLDDLHAADAPTLRLLDFVVRHLHASAILVLALYQESYTEAGAQLADLSRTTMRLRLGGLDRDEVAELVVRHAPGGDPSVLAGRIHELTAGNPFFTAEVVRLLAAEGPDAPLRLPDGVRATIWRRLSPLHEDAIRTLQAGAVIGMEFRADTLALATGADHVALRDHLDTAVRENILATLAAGPDRYAFAHSLIRETLYADLPPTRRQALHGAVGEALERVYGPAVEEHLGEISHHLLAAGSDRGPELSERAGRHELGRLAFEQAERHFARALEALREDEPASERAGELMLAQGEAAMRAGRPAQARRRLAEACEVARRLGLADLFARATLAMVPWGFNVRIDDAQLTALLGEALVRAEAEPAGLRARLLSALARTTYWSDPPQRRLERVERAVALAREAGDDRTLARVLGDAHIATWNPDGNDRSLAWTDEMLEIADRTGDRSLALDAHSWRMALLLEGGDVAGMDAAYALSARMARETNEPRALALVRRHESARALISGDFELAGRSLAESVELTKRLEADEMAVMLVGALAFAIAWHRDDLEPLLPAIRDFADRNPEFPSWRCALAGALARTGRSAEARRELTAARGPGFAQMPRDNLWLVGSALAAEAAHRLPHLEAAGELAALLAPFGGRNVVTPDGLYFGPVDRFRALLARTLGDEQEALEHHRRARAAAEALGAAPVLAELDRDEQRAGAPVAGPAPAAAPERPAVLCREGDYWRIAFAGEPFLLKDAKGLRHLARLLDQPDTPLHVLDLGAGTVAREERGDDDAGPVLDAQAKAQYRRRVTELEEEIEEADAFHDVERASRAREELAFLATELRAAVGLGGRDRRAASSAERARVNVTRQIRSAIERIAAHDDALGRHLESAVRTGTFCVYRPAPGSPKWELTA